jgi:hypothetical protein
MSTKIETTMGELSYYERNKQRIKEQAKEYYLKNRQEKIIKQRKYYQTNKEKIQPTRKKYTKEYFEKNRDKINAQFRKKYHNNKEEFKKKYEENKELYLARNKKSNEKYKEKRLEYSKKYFIENQKKVCEINRQYYRNNIDKCKARVKKYNNDPINRLKTIEYYRNRYKNNIQFKLGHNLRGRIQQAVKKQNTKKAERAEKLIGCTIEYFKQYLESLWQPGMCWENYKYDGWHIDHIKPCNTFDLTSSEQQKHCFHYTNLRPLWAKDNLSRPKDGSDLL